MQRQTVSKFLVVLIVIPIAIKAWQAVRLAQVPPPAASQPTRKPTGGELLADRSSIDALLKKYVENGRVDYAGLKKEEDQLQAYLEQLANVQTEQLSRDALLALYLDAYNTATLKLILEHFPGIRSIQDIPEDKRWKDRRWKVAGQAWSLDELEHKVLREQFKDPRIHFAMVCASNSCPALRPEAYEGAKLNAQLDDQMRQFHRDPRHFRWDEASKTVYLSSIYKWFAEDFGPDEKSAIDFVARYVEPDVADALREHRATLTIRYLEYDWKLNGQ